MGVNQSSGQDLSSGPDLYVNLIYADSEGIKKKVDEGADLESEDKEGNTPLILASMNSHLYDVAKTLIEVGANVNAYRPGRHAGTPLHHAAKRGLEQMVKLLLINGADAMIMNHDDQTALDVARDEGHSNVVRAIENYICLFSGWLLEHYGPAPQPLSREVWVVILPCEADRRRQLAIYSSAQDAKPRIIIPLWEANMDEPNFNQPDPEVIISSSSTESLIKLAAVNEKQQLQQFSDACKGIPQVMRPALPFNNQGPNVGPTAQTTTKEDPELDIATAKALSASLLSSSVTEADYDLDMAKALSASLQSSSTDVDDDLDVAKALSASLHSSSAPANITPSLIPSAPPLPVIVDDGPIRYPSIDYTPSDLSETTPAATTGEKDKREGDSSSCVICLDAPFEGACVPCGHRAGCMSCLTEIKRKNWGCPVCRTKIDQVIRVYAV